MSAETAASNTLGRWYDAWNAQDLEAISALMTDDVRYEDPGAATFPMSGRTAVADHARRAFAGIPDVHLDKLEAWVTPGGEVIASYFRFSGTFNAQLTAPGLPFLAPTGGHLELLGMDRSEIRDERVARRLQRLTARRLRQAS